MPNWCQNRLTVHGPAEDVNSFQMQAGMMMAKDTDERTELSLQQLLPCPPCLLNGGSQQLNPADSPIDYMTKLDPKADIPIEKDDWYSWRVRYWGTKWDIEARIEKMENYQNGNRKVVYVFDSAWSPPCEAFKRICEEWPTLTFRLTYSEPGMNFRGSETFKASINAVDNNSAA